MAKIERARHAQRILMIDTRGIEVDVGEEEIHLRVDGTLPLPHAAFDIIEAWAAEVEGLDAPRFRDEVGEFVGRKLDEQWLIARLRS